LILCKAETGEKLPDIFISDDKATHKGNKSARFQDILNSMCIIQSLNLKGA